MFYVGQKVVCVNDGPSRWTGEPTTVNAGTIYTIHAVRPNPRSRGYTVDLVEIDPFPGHDGFDPARFRPAVERKTDISIFTKMLTPKRISVGAD